MNSTQDCIPANFQISGGTSEGPPQKVTFPTPKKAIAQLNLTLFCTFSPVPNVIGTAGTAVT